MSERALRATYRLQLTSEFGFAAARELLPYLRELGISHLYLSPILQAVSAHGYDVTDPSRISDRLGGEDEFRALVAAAHEQGMGVVLDVVPNHMSHDAPYPDFFDVDPVSGHRRRFFDIDDLSAIRVEDPAVFETTHAKTLALTAEGLIDGLRVDHPDGLTDPTGYLRRLQSRGVERVWVEKILAATEALPSAWPVSGTVGYDFLNDLVALFTDPAGEQPLTDFWQQLAGDGRPFGAYAHEAKLQQARGPFTPEVERLGRIPGAPSTEAIAHALASLPVYRTYDPPSAGEYWTRFQQTSPAIMAKGVEDTAFYRYGRLLALNEVGGDPDRFHISPADFHAANAVRAARYPESLLTTMTHDAKRSADVRARIVAISHHAQEWVELAGRWLQFEYGEPAPDAVERYFVLQTLAGAHPIEPDRLDSYLVKALREAKRSSNWTSPDVRHEAGVLAWARALGNDPRFFSEFNPFLAKLTVLGKRIHLAWLALKLMSPGVPDIYQGDELEFRALVDPDNRRPVDYALRQETLAELAGGGLPSRAAHKMYVIKTLLRLRAQRPEGFTSYEPIPTGDGACAFTRGGQLLTVVAPASAQAVRSPGAGWEAVLELPGVNVFARAGR